MALQRFGFIVKGAGYDPDRYTARIESSQMMTTVIGISAPEQALLVAKQMVADGRAAHRAMRGIRPDLDRPRD